MLVALLVGCNSDSESSPEKAPSLPEQETELQVSSTFVDNCDSEITKSEREVFFRYYTRDRNERPMLLRTTLNQTPAANSTGNPQMRTIAGETWYVTTFALPATFFDGTFNGIVGIHYPSTPNKNRYFAGRAPSAYKPPAGRAVDYCRPEQALSFVWIGGNRMWATRRPIQDNQVDGVINELQKKP